MNSTNFLYLVRCLFGVSLIFLFIQTKGIAQVLDTTMVWSLLSEIDHISSPEDVQSQLESAYSVANQLSFTPGLLVILPRLAALEMQNNQLVNSLQYLLEERALLENQPQTKRQIEVNITIGELYSQEGLNDVALTYFLHAEKLIPRIDRNSLSVIHDQIGAQYAKLSMPDSAAYYYLRAVDLSGGDELDQLNTNRKLVLAYQIAEDYEEAIQYHLNIKAILERDRKRPNELGVLYNNLGFNYHFLGKYDQSVKWFLEAEPLLDASDEQLATLYTNLGVGYFNLGNHQQSVYYLLKALSIGGPTNDEATGHINNLLAKVYLDQDDFYNAQKHNDLAVEAANRSRKVSLISDSYATAADIHAELYEYEEAIGDLQRHLHLRDSMALAKQVEQQQMERQQANLKEAENKIKRLIIDGKLQALTIERLTLEKESNRLAIDNLTLKTAEAEKDLALLRQSEQLQETTLKNQILENNQTKQQLLLAQRALEIQTRERELESLAQTEALTQKELERKEAQLIQEQQQVSLLEKQSQIDQLELATQKQNTLAVLRVGGLLLLVSLLILGGLIYARRTNKKLAEQKLKIETEQEKSEQLLLNILPANIVQELKEKGETVPRKHNSVSILFSDFVGFTRISAQNTPEVIFHELNDCFQGFDAIMAEEGIEKIQTVGDGYLAVGGLTQDGHDHAIQCVRAAKKMIAFLAERNQHCDIHWHVRVGIHSGPITAGVVGTKKFAYNIFGDTVNTASRIETAGEKGRVNVSNTTYQLIKDHFPCEYRGKIAAKGKGELDMYFVA